MTASEQALALLRERGVAGQVDIGLVLGTGLGSIAEVIEEGVVVPYADIPGFPETTVSGHAGNLSVGRWEGSRVAIMQGRAHQYERGDPAAMRVPIEVLARLGVKTLVLTNSAGSTHADWYPGSIVMLTDHINLTGLNPLAGVEGDGRFVAMNDAYDRHLRTRMRAAVAASGVPALKEGVYMWFPGPSFETAAEVKIAKTLGADLVGMSTVPETVLARYFGMRVVALSIVTNFAAGVSHAHPSHAETKSGALAGSIAMKRLLRAFMRLDG